MKENDIRPDNLRSGLEAQLRKDILFLRGRMNEFHEINCPACETPNRKVYFQKNNFNYCQCSNCNMLYMNPRANEQILGEFYSGSATYKFFNDYIFPASKEMRRTSIFIPRVDKVIRICEQYKIKKDKILEIGAGFGIFCEEMAKRNYFREIVAIEATDSLYETSKQKGFRTYQGILEDLTIAEKFDFIVAFEVMEHISNPFKNLLKINGLLETNGMLMLTFPNCDGFDISILDKKSDSIDHEHINYFNAKAIKIILERSGYNVVSIETPGRLDVELVRKKIISGHYFPSGFIRTICIDNYDEIGDKFQDFLMQNNLSSHMLIVARKV